MSTRREFMRRAAAAAVTGAAAPLARSAQSKPVAPSGGVNKRSRTSGASDNGGSLLISGATLIDGVADQPIAGKSIWIERGRIKAIGTRDELGSQARRAQALDARGKYLIPGLMNANVHLFGPTTLEGLARYTDRYEDVIIESAQLALKNGLTTVFDTWGPRRFLMNARDRINAGQATGSRIFCAGNIVGFDGPLSADFFPKAVEVASTAFARRVNAIFVENVGRHLVWLPPERVAQEVRAYIGRGIDFVKYGSNEHFWASSGAFLAFSTHQQAAIVDEARRAGLTVQAHAMSVEGLRAAIEAGCDLMTHCNNTGMVPMPESTLELFVKQKTGAVVFPQTQRRLEWLMENGGLKGAMTWKAYDTNARNLIRVGAALMLGNDGTLYPPEVATDPMLSKSWMAPGEDNLGDLGAGHFVWFRAMEEKGCAPMTLLRAATRNIAVAYGKDRDLGTLEAGKIADLLILDKNPLEAATNYRTIQTVIKDGVVVDRDALPRVPLLTKPLEHAEEEARYVPFLGGESSAPMGAVDSVGR